MFLTHFARRFLFTICFSILLYLTIKEERVGCEIIRRFTDNDNYSNDNNNNNNNNGYRNYRETVNKYPAQNTFDVLLIDRLGESVIFRGRNPVIGNTFRYRELVKEMENVSYAVSGVSLAETFELIVVNLVDQSGYPEANTIEVEMIYFAIRPCKGRVIHHPLNGNPNSPYSDHSYAYDATVVASEVRGNATGSSSSVRFPDNDLDGLLRELYSIFSSNETSSSSSQGKIPTVIYVHSSSSEGKGKTSEFHMAWGIRYSNKTLEDVYGDDFNLTGEYPEEKYGNAVVWYCFYLKFVLVAENDSSSARRVGRGYRNYSTLDCRLTIPPSAPPSPSPSPSPSPFSPTNKPTLSPTFFPTTVPNPLLCNVTLSQTREGLWSSSGVITTQWSVKLINLNDRGNSGEIILLMSDESLVLDSWNIQCSAGGKCTMPDWDPVYLTGGQQYEWHYIISSPYESIITFQSPIACSLPPTPRPPYQGPCTLSVSQNMAESWVSDGVNYNNWNVMLRNSSPTRYIFYANFTTSSPFLEIWGVDPSPRSSTISFELSSSLTGIPPLGDYTFGYKAHERLTLTVGNVPSECRGVSF
jgi:hypothetical protein